MHWSGMALNASKTFLTCTRADRIPTTPITITVRKRPAEYTRLDDGTYRRCHDAGTESEVAITFSSPDSPFTYLGITFTGSYDFTPHWQNVERIFNRDLALLNSKRATFAELWYAVQAVIHARLAYGTHITLPSPTRLSRWNKRLESLLRSSLHSPLASGKILYAGYKQGGLQALSLTTQIHQRIAAELQNLLNREGTIEYGLLSSVISFLP